MAGHAGVRHQRRHASTTTASPRSTSTCATCSPATGCPSARDGWRRSPGRPRPAATRCFRRAGCATSPRSPRPCAATTHETAGVGRARAAPPAPARRRASSSARPVARRRCEPRPSSALPVRRPRRCSTTWPRTVEDYSGDELVVHGARHGAAHAADPRDAVGQPDPAGRAAPLRRPRRAAAVPAHARTCPGRFPFTAGVFPFKREGEDPARMFAGEGDPFRTNRRFKLLSRGQPGHAAVDGVRLGHALRPRPRRASRHLRQGRHVRASRSRRSTT